MSARRGIWVFLGLLAVLGVMVLLAVLNLRHAATTVSTSTVLTFDVPEELEESEPPWHFLPPLRWVRSDHRYTLLNVVQGIRRAAADDRIAALVLRIDRVDWGWGKLAEVREAILRFRETGKPVYASLDGGGEAEYYLASAGATVALTPAALFEMNGLTASALFLRGTFEKLGVSPNFASAGRFKSGVEGYTRTGMSPEMRESLEALLDDEYRIVVDGLAEGRGLPADSIQRLMDEGPFEGEAARAHGLVDTLISAGELDSIALHALPRRAHWMSLARYIDRLPAGAGPRIAWIAASGTIVSGRSRVDPVEGVALGSQTLVEALRDARTNRLIEAIILRIDSPGGMMTASEEIWREVNRCREAKPVVASMSDVAASGGYYIALAADWIVARPVTLTGSIGVYGGKLNVLGLYRKLGMNVETIARGRHAEMMSPYRDFTAEETRRYRQHLEDSYQLFLRRVSEGRGLTVAAADSISQGRVWSGLAAHARGLVDTLGGVETAFRIALEEAGYPADTRFALERYPKVKRRLFERLLTEWLGEEALQGLLGPLPPPMLQAWILVSRFPTGAALAMMPYRVEIR